MFGIFEKKISHYDLKEAIKAGDILTVEKAVTQGLDINQAPAEDDCALIVAIKEKKENIFEFLLQHGANPNCKTMDGEPAITRYELLPAVSAGEIDDNVSYKMIELLIEKGAKFDTPDEEGKTLLMTAAYTDRRKLAELLMKNGSDLEYKTISEHHAYEFNTLVHYGFEHYSRGEGGWDLEATALQYSVRNGNISVYSGGRKRSYSHKVLELFLTKKPTFKNVAVTIKVAIACDDTLALEMLIPYCIQLNPSEEMIKSLHEQIDLGVLSAIHNGAVNSVSFLAKNNLLNVVLLDSCINNDVLGLESLLAEFDEIRDKELKVAAMIGGKHNAECIISLQKYRSRIINAHQIFVQMASSTTPVTETKGGEKSVRDLLIAIEENNKNTIQNIIKSSPELLNQVFREEGKTDLTPLTWAIFKNNEVIELLVKGGADINLVSEDDIRPIQQAVIGKHLEAVRTLKKLGAQLEFPNDPDFKDLFDIATASKKDNSETIKFLIELGLSPRTSHAPLMAILGSKIAEVTTYLDADIDINFQHDNRCLLGAAIHKNNLNLVKQLVALGADTTLVDLNGFDALSDDIVNYFQNLSKGTHTLIKKTG